MRQNNGLVTLTLPKTQWGVPSRLKENKDFCTIEANCPKEHTCTAIRRVSQYSMQLRWILVNGEWVA